MKDTSYTEFLFSTFLSVFHCPSDKKPDTWTFTNDGPTGWYAAQNVRRSNYFFATGATTDFSANYEEFNRSTTWMDNEPRTNLYEYQGMFGNNGAAEISTVRDGLSNSIAMGESIQEKYSSHFGPFWGAGVHSCCHGFVPVRDLVISGELATFHINGRWQATVNPVTGQCTRGLWSRCVFAWVFSSYHPGGAQFVMGDGSVKFLSERMKYKNFRLLNYIHDGNPVEFDNGRSGQRRSTASERFLPVRTPSDSG